MRILYGVSGHGNGHITRSSYIVSLLQRENHQVKIVTYGQGTSYVRKYHPQYDILDISGYEIYYKNGVVRNYKTFYEFLKHIPINSVKNFPHLIDILIKFKPQIIISDFEPFTQILAKTFNIPLIGIDNIIATLKVKERPNKRPTTEAMFTIGTIHLFMRCAKYHFVLTFAPDFIKMDDDARKLIIVPPIIRNKVIDIADKVEDGGYMLVYQTSESMTESLNKIIGKFPNVKFIVYRLKVEKRSNVEMKEFSGEGFIEDLARCSGVITNGGFSLISEALYLKKPVYAVPIKGQYEQKINSFLVEKAGYGLSSGKFDEVVFEKFISNIEVYKKNLYEYKQDGNNFFEKKITNLLNHFREEIPSPDYLRFINRIIPLIQVLSIRFIFRDAFDLIKKKIIFNKINKDS